MPEAETDACVVCGRLPQDGDTQWIVYNDPTQGAVTYYCSECGERELEEPPDELDDGKEFWQRESGWILVRRESSGHLFPFNEETSEGMIIEDWGDPEGTKQRMIDDGVRVISEGEWKANKDLYEERLDGFFRERRVVKARFVRW